MRRLPNIIICTIGTLAMLIAPMIPHHHHGEVICAIMEQCEMDGEVNDEHTEHHGNQEGKGCSSCDKNAQWYDIKSSNQRYTHDTYALPLLTLLGYEWHFEGKKTDKTRLKPRKSTPQACKLSVRTKGLRAPPRFFISTVEQTEC